MKTRASAVKLKERENNDKMIRIVILSSRSIMTLTPFSYFKVQINEPFFTINMIININYINRYYHHSNKYLMI